MSTARDKDKDMGDDDDDGEVKETKAYRHIDDLT